MARVCNSSLTSLAHDADEGVGCLIDAFAEWDDGYAAAPQRSLARCSNEVTAMKTNLPAPSAWPCYPSRFLQHSRLSRSLANHGFGCRGTVSESGMNVMPGQASAPKGRVGEVGAPASAAVNIGAFNRAIRACRRIC
jgi:hypothetical protein